MTGKREKDLIDEKLFKRAREALDRVSVDIELKEPVDTGGEETVPSSAPGFPETPIGDVADRALLKTVALSKTYFNGSRGISVLRDVNLSISRGDMVAITGPSGCGKSTLLFILGLFLSASGGGYFFEGTDVLKLGRSDQAEFRRNQVGFIFQSTDLLENTTVYENLEFPLIYAGIERRSRPARISKALEILSLGHRIRHSANQLSGGEKQRVAVARALVNQPRVILADEPTGQLDRDNTQQIMDHLEEIVLQGETAVIVVTHDPQVADRCTRVCSLVDGQLYEG